jgi:hypothetical protein
LVLPYTTPADVLSRYLPLLTDLKRAEIKPPEVICLAQRCPATAVLHGEAKIVPALMSRQRAGDVPMFRMQAN